MTATRRGLAIATIGVGLALVIAAPAFGSAEHGCQGYQSLYSWYGVTGKTYTYDGWDAWQHVSSFYAHAPNGTGYGEYNYIEAGIMAGHEDYSTAFIAYENFPDTPMREDHTGQVNVTGYLQPTMSWVYCEINNQTIGGSNWYAAVGGQTLLHGLSLWKVDYSYPYTRTACPQARLRSTAERWEGDGVDNRTSSYLLKMKDSSGNWYDWSSMVNSDDDDYWDWYKVNNTYWYTVYNTVDP